MPKGQANDYTAEELAWIEERKHLPREMLHLGFQIAFDRYEVTKGAICNLCKRKGWLTGRTGRIEKGNVPPNKGKKGFHAPGCEKGWFKKGRDPKLARNYQPIGTERVTREGYIERKIHDGLPLQSRWRAVHLIRWEAENGPLPAGHALKCLNGDKGNTDPSNWKMIPRAMLPRLNGRFGRDYDNAPADLRPTIMAIAELEHQARSKKA